jgi:hypothetical protein
MGRFGLSESIPRPSSAACESQTEKGEGWAVVRKYVNFDRSTEATEYSRMATSTIRFRPETRFDNSKGSPKVTEVGDWRRQSSSETP